MGFDNGGDGAGDVELTACGSELAGFGNVEVDVTNRGSNQSSYGVTVAFDAEDGSQLGTTSVYVRSLLPGQSSHEQATGFFELPIGTEPGPFTCRVADVSRYAD